MSLVTPNVPVFSAIVKQVQLSTERSLSHVRGLLFSEPLLTTSTNSGHLLFHLLIVIPFSLDTRVKRWKPMDRC
jgi:hypothetical protein